ncbi:hypothetical protein DR950_32325 [Kitasatospora xanthocidica]|uniref:Uncharacterized protein n=1 Tax=Kitasatospora xanthocidica TaxID=83382 RepID=A0A373A0W6_9ACTN|nr:hypothetical protein [Kitasatospora xanthocidica]RGD61808.1 hypothetical protein DR950_32325 [Kitasatospora xanthocidica]
MNLATLARHALSRDHTPAETYALIARRTGRPFPSARAVCLALSIPLAETTRRLADCYDALLADPHPNSENDTGELLEALGVFDIPKSLTDTELAVVDLFLTAVDAMGGIRPGHRHGLQRWFTTGNLTAAYLSLAAARPMPRTGSPVLYWATLVTAGELLTTTPSPDTRIKYALVRCRERAERITAGPAGLAGPAAK